MKIKVSLTVGEDVVKHETIEVDDRKFVELSEDEVEAAIEVLIRAWAERHVQIAWEVEQKS